MSNKHIEVLEELVDPKEIEVRVITQYGLTKINYIDKYRNALQHAIDVLRRVDSIIPHVKNRINIETEYGWRVIKDEEVKSYIKGE